MAFLDEPLTDVTLQIAHHLVLKCAPVNVHIVYFHLLTAMGVYFRFYFFMFLFEF